MVPFYYYGIILLRKFVGGKMTKDQFNNQLVIIYDDLYRFIFSIVKNKTSCDDVIMVAIISSLQNRRQLKEDNKFKPWIFQIAKRESVNYLVKNKREIPKGHLDKELLSEEISIEKKYINKETEKRMYAAILKLENTDQYILHYKYYCNMTFNEIGETLHLNVNTVKTKNKRVLEKLKKTIERNDND